ncbi:MULTISPECIES: TolC family protein [unclassified Imperialibacter]|uniref:TolC family protein n=1 Tax=unclassified Imperialibacter TaxID=2629706 RepID=UPI0012578E7C|nr:MULTISPECIES: TolC family protein [unclassified Imperialibacter]CAD5256979.1 Outer membrane protein [Imperialibacter sp. 75]CAD5259860.1 Outer membrane protein [Imperialibacter sp. 89]VVT26009.1 Outer membrane protein [Imperialibacter sp. EC-SDR9]
MFKKMVFAIGACLISCLGVAQSQEILGILEQIERNNKDLQAFRSLTQSRELELKSGNNLPDPQFGVYYLPWSDHPGGDYTEFQLTQSIEFPTVYGARSSVNSIQLEQLKLDYTSGRNEILLKALSGCYELLFLNQTIEVEEKRLEQSEEVYRHTQLLYDKQQVGRLEFNKAKVFRAQQLFRIDQLQNEKKNQLLELRNLNGGEELTLNLDSWNQHLDVPSQETLWQEKLLLDPELLGLSKQEEVAAGLVRLAQNKGLPHLTAGFNRQGVSGSYYSGIYGGLSIPLWSNRNKVRAARASLDYHELHSGVRSLMLATDFGKQYNDYQLKLSQYQDYKAALGDVQSDTLLLKAYTLGELSFIEYYMELQFFREAQDYLLEMEKQVHMLRAQLLKHQL